MGLLLLFTGLSLFGEGRAETVVDKACVPLSLFIAGLPVLRYLRSTSRAGRSAGKVALRVALGVFCGLFGGYFLWNVLRFLTLTTIRGGRFDLAASWGSLLLAGALAFWIAASGGSKSVSAKSG